jgi:hypothetical protein
MSGRTRDGGSLRILNIVNEYTRVALGSRVDRSIGASGVVSELARLFGRNGKPQVLRSDNGANSSQTSLLDWLAEHGSPGLLREGVVAAAKPVRGVLHGPNPGAGSLAFTL